jgi:DNA polymerase I-like protein with 3'-5' exonuclease and polymerase domains
MSDTKHNNKFIHIVTRADSSSDWCSQASTTTPLAVTHPLVIPDGKDAGRVLMGIYAPDQAPLCTSLPVEEHDKFIDTLVMDTPVRIVTHDLKTWLQPVYERKGTDIRIHNDINRFSCTYLLAYLMDPPERIEGEIEGDVETSLLLENLVLKYLGEPYPRLETWLLGKDPSDALYWRLWEDARYVGRLWDAMVRLLTKKPDGEDLLRLYHEIELPLIPALLDMECRGIRVNQPRADKMLGIVERVLDYLRDRISKSLAVPSAFNPMNDDQVEQFLVRSCGADLLGRGINDDTLWQFATSNPAIRYIARYRKITRNAAFLRTAAGSPSGFVHATFSQCSTSTGRLAVRNPPLQAIRRNTRKVYLLPDEGHVMVEADYSQAEARLLAVASEAPVLCGIFADDGSPELETARRGHLGSLYALWSENRDFHLITARWLSRLLNTTITRDNSKMVMYAISYGMSARSLSMQLGISEDQAEAVISAFYETYPGVWEWKQRVIADLTKRGKRPSIAGRYLRTPSGRRRMFDRSFTEYEGEERRAVNFLLQGQVADLIKQAQVRLYRELLLRKMKARIVLQLHDALYTSVPEDEIGSAVDLIESAMRSRFPVPSLGYTISMPVEIKIR